MRNQHEVRAVAEAPVHIQPCFICKSTYPQGEHCPTDPSVKVLMVEHANVVGQYKPSTNTQYNNVYNPNWRNRPNLYWKPNPPAYVPPAAQQQQQCGSSSQPHPPPSSSLVEQANLNLSKVVGNFVEEQKTINVQLTQKINTVESTLNNHNGWAPK